ncbi:helix-turn-helix domain-containing protein [Acinetobacter defluvii]|uniref:helix-turn-helix domain-containing protein n=1 Tax=Acinetobacter defluvii TaxID=1871111 RepID=UPI002B3FFEC8|nr:helix-turn-helix transcriptional regulator [Acinetobacter defluvii]
MQGFFKLNEVAEKLNISERTLQRQLSAEGTTFLKLQDEVRKKHAKLLLNNENKTIEQVALQLGYSETSQFTRAFKRWMKMTPKSYQMIVKNKLL